MPPSPVWIGGRRESSRNLSDRERRNGFCENQKKSKDLSFPIVLLGKMMPHERHG